jgi:hypothetical protein
MATNEELMAEAGDEDRIMSGWAPRKSDMTWAGLPQLGMVII